MMLALWVYHGIPLLCGNDYKLKSDIQALAGPFFAEIWKTKKGAFQEVYSSWIQPTKVTSSVQSHQTQRAN